jgi:hypothetical protein
MPTKSTRAKRTDDAIWGRLIGPDDEALSPEAARFILALDFPEEDRAQMRALAEKARNGTLTATEQEEVETYSRVGSILGILQSKARVALKKTGKTNGRGRR